MTCRALLLGEASASSLFNFIKFLQKHGIIHLTYECSVIVMMIIVKGNCLWFFMILDLAIPWSML